MNSFFQTLFHLGVRIETLLKRASQGIERLFLSKDEAGRRDTGRLETIQRREFEAERLDRLRNPGDYEGK